MRRPREFPRRTKAIADLCQELNKIRTRRLGTQLTIQYQIAELDTRIGQV